MEEDDYGRNYLEEELNDRDHRKDNNDDDPLLDSDRDRDHLEDNSDNDHSQDRDYDINNQS